MDAQNCFEGCSSSPSSDANGNTGNGLDRGRFTEEGTASPHEETEVSGGMMEKPAEKKLASHATERERLVTTPAEKSEMVVVLIFVFLTWSLFFGVIPAGREITLF